MPLNVAFEPNIQYVTVVDSGPVRVDQDHAAKAVAHGRPVEMTTVGNGQTFQAIVKLDPDGNPCVIPVTPREPIGAEKSQILGQLLIQAGVFADNVSHLIDG